MDPYEKQTDILKALAHPVRLQILDALRAGPECVCHLEALLGLRQAYVSQQLARLREAGLVTDQKDGLNVFYRVANMRVFDIIDEVSGVARVPADEWPVPITMQRKRVADCPCPKCHPIPAAAVS